MLRHLINDILVVIWPQGSTIISSVRGGTGRKRRSDRNSSKVSRKEELVDAYKIKKIMNGLTKYSS